MENGLGREGVRMTPPPRTVEPEGTERNEDKWWQVGNFKVWGSGLLAWATNQQPSQFMDEEQVRGGYTRPGFRTQFSPSVSSVEFLKFSWVLGFTVL